MTQIAPNDHRAYMAHALSLARKSPPQSTNYAVGAVLVDPETNTILAEGYTLELPGNTHAEQCCFDKYDAALLANQQQQQQQQQNLALYTTMEPCSMRLSGAVPCVQRILARGPGVIGTVYVGVLEPTVFVATNAGRATLEQAGVKFVHVAGMEEEILKVARAGHKAQES